MTTLGRRYCIRMAHLDMVYLMPEPVQAAQVLDRISPASADGRARWVPRLVDPAVQQLRNIWAEPFTS